MNAEVLALRDVHMHVPIRDAWGRRTGWLRAVDGVTLSVTRGETMGASSGTATSMGRVYEEVVQRSVIQGLQATAMILVEIGENGSRRVINLDVNPAIVGVVPEGQMEMIT